jgi:hypothetical protein
MADTSAPGQSVLTVHNLIKLLVENSTTLLLTVSDYDDWPDFNGLSAKGAAAGKKSTVGQFEELVPNCKELLDLEDVGGTNFVLRQAILLAIKGLIFMMEKELDYVNIGLNPDQVRLINHHPALRHNPSSSLVLPSMPGTVDIMTSPLPNSSSSQTPGTPNSPSHFPQTEEIETDDRYGLVTFANLNQKVLVFETILKNLDSIQAVFLSATTGQETQEEDFSLKPKKGKRCIVQNQIVTSVSHVVGRTKRPKGRPQW